MKQSNVDQDQIAKVSKEELLKLTEELKFRKESLREEIRVELKEALDLGDIPENFPYDAAVERHKFNEERIQSLEWLIRTSKVIDSALNSTVKVNNTIIIQKLGAEKKTVKIVTKDYLKLNPLPGNITVDSPVGSVVIGKRVGDIIKVNLPTGVFEYKILKIVS